MLKSDPRKIIKFGNASHVISLPSSWIKENNLKKGDLIYLEKNSNNQLEVLPKPEENSEDLIINISPVDLTTLQREVSSAYTKGFSTIIFSRENFEILPSQIKDLTENKIGAEIFKITEKQGIIKISLDEENISLKEMVRRMDNLLRLMMDTLVKQITEPENKLLHHNEIRNMDDDINKIYFLVWRLTNTYLENKRSLKEKLNLSELANSKILAINLEHIGDELKRIAKFILKTKLRKNSINSLKNSILNLKEIHKGTMQSVYKKDPNFALNIIKDKNKSLTSYDALFNKNKDIILGKITEKLKDLSNHVYNNAKLVIY